MRPTRSTRHAKPAFDVVRDAVEDTRTGWVYRSDTRPAATAAKPASAQAIAPPARFVPSLPPRSNVVLLPKPKIAPAAPPPLTWVAGAMAMMSLPFVITAGMMIAPMALMLAAVRKSTNG